MNKIIIISILIISAFSIVSVLGRAILNEMRLISKDRQVEKNKDVLIVSQTPEQFQELYALQVELQRELYLIKYKIMKEDKYRRSSDVRTSTHIRTAQPTKIAKSSFDIQEFTTQHVYGA